MANDNLSPQQVAEIVNYYQAPERNQNATVKDALALTASLRSIPLFGSLEIWVLPGKLGAGPSAPAMRLDAFMSHLGGDLPLETELFLHYRAPSGLLNVDLLLKFFSHNWEVGIMAVAVQGYGDTRPALVLLTQNEKVNAAVNFEAAKLFGAFRAAPPPQVGDLRFEVPPPEPQPLD